MFRIERHAIGCGFCRLIYVVIVFLVFSMPLSAHTQGQHPFDYRIDNEAGEPPFNNTNGTLVLIQPLPAVLSYVPEPITYFKKNDVTGISQMANKAIAKLGTLTFDAIVTGYRSVDGAYTEEQLAEMVGTPQYITELYMNANSYYTYNQLSNESDLTFRDQDGNTRTMHVQLVCVEHLNSETRYLNLSYTGGGWRVGTNPALFNNSGKRFYPGNTIDFYLMTTENWDSNLLLDSTSKAEIDANFRDITKWSYRFGGPGVTSNDRYETKGMELAGYGPMNNDVVHNGFSYNVPPDVKINEVWSYTMNPTATATQLDATTDAPQKIANATITPVNFFEAVNFSVIYSFKSLGNTDGKFYLKNDALPGVRIPYNLVFSPHGMGNYIEAEKEYVWHLAYVIDGAGELYVDKFATSTHDAAAGTWYDTIQVTITSTDNEYSAST